MRASLIVQGACDGCRLKLLDSDLHAVLKMKYPEHTVTQPIVGEAAARLIGAIDSGEGDVSEAARRTAVDALKLWRRSKRPANEEGPLRPG